MSHKLKSCRPQWSAEGIGRLASEKTLVYDALRKYMRKMLERFTMVGNGIVLVASSEDDIHFKPETESSSAKNTPTLLQCSHSFLRPDKSIRIALGIFCERCATGAATGATTVSYACLIWERLLYVCLYVGSMYMYMYARLL